MATVGADAFRRGDLSRSLVSPSPFTEREVVEGAVALVHHSTPDGHMRGQVEAEAKKSKNTPWCTLDIQVSEAKSLSGP